MINHPNRKKTYPNNLLADACRKAGAHVQLMWEIPGPKNTMVAWLSCYQIGKSICIVQTFKGHDGWNAFTPCSDNSVSGTIADVLNRCGVPVPEYVADGWSQNPEAHAAFTKHFKT